MSEESKKARYRSVFWTHPLGSVKGLGLVIDKMPYKDASPFIELIDLSYMPNLMYKLHLTRNDIKTIVKRLQEILEMEWIDYG